jgi:hypothetical protein
MSDDIDALAGRWIDGEALTPAEGDAPAGLNDAGRRRLADLQLLHGLLGQLREGESAAREARVRNVLRALEAPPPTLPLRRRAPVRRVLSWVTAAAAVLLGVLLWGKFGAANPAYAVMARALQAAGEERDRTYDVTDTWGEPEQSRLTAVLQFRGDKFLFRPLAPPWDGTLVGGNGRQSWVVPKSGAVLVSDDPRAFFRLVRGAVLPDRRGDRGRSREGETLPFLHLPAMLERFSRSYDLQLLAPEALDDGGPGYQHIRGARRAGVEDGPESVEVWAHPQTGVARRLRLDLGEGPGARRLTLDLASEAPLPADWYEHSAHHDPKRPVRPWSPPEERGRGQVSLLQPEGATP